MLIAEYFPNDTPVAKFTESTTSYRILATDGNTYDTLAALLAAGKTAFPGLDPGAWTGALAMVCTNGSNAAGSAFRFRINPSSAPSSGDGQWIPGGSIAVKNPGIVNSVWLQKTVAGDVVECIASY